MKTALLLLALAVVATTAFESASKHLVTGLPGSHLINETMYTGFVTVEPVNQAKLFYWFVESRSNPKTDPLVLWMTGGPGCSSELALVFENGPFTVEKDLTLKPNPHSWNQKANVIYIDQPFGTGFSPPSIDIVSDEALMAEYMYDFLQGFYLTYPQYAKTPFHITGESYAGHYIPALSARIVKGNQDNQNPKINFVSAAIGNGWVDPVVQYGSYGNFALANGLITKPVYALMEANYLECKNLISKAVTVEDWIKAEDVCSAIMEEVLLTAPKINGSRINVYNIKQPCTVPGLCYDFTAQTKYMNLPQTQTALGVKTKWTSCSRTAGMPLVIDRIRSYKYDIPIVLAAGVKVLIYSGKYDLICEYMGGLAWVHSMTWPHQTAFNNLQLHQWSAAGHKAGEAKTLGGLSFLQVDEAGHMVPHDQPVAAYAMLEQILAGHPF